MNTSEHVAALYERGFTVLPAYFDAADCQKMRDIMDNYWKSQGSPSVSAHAFGFTIHPLMSSIPELAPFLDVPAAIEILGEALRDDVRVMHLGARTSGPQSVERLPWHNHYQSSSQPNAWNPDDLPKRDRLERILCGVYVDGTLPESGAFVALPRRFNDPLGAALGDESEAWRGAEKLEVPPGSVTFADTALWHTALRGSGTAMRRTWGGHYQGWSDARPHPEDNFVDAAQIAGYKNELPRLKKLIDGN